MGRLATGAFMVFPPIMTSYPFNLGGHSREVSTQSPEAQTWFDRGLNWCFGFHQEEGVRCFQRALDYDPACVMAHWGVAYGCGPFYNLAWHEFGAAEAAASTALATAHIARARTCYGGATVLEIELVEALACRFQQPHPVTRAEYARWDDDYAAALRRVHFAHPDDLDVAALLIEALITRTPRRLWDVTTGRPARNSDVLEALAVCENAIALAEARGGAPHPALLHLHIHIMEMSNEPERAMRSADLLGSLCPDAGHLNHMPGHIYALCGAYDRARMASGKAIAADDEYADYDRGLNFYLTARCHDIHLLMFVCMFLGQYGPALEASRKLRSLITREVVALQDRPKLAMTSEGYYSMHMHVLVRFGRWHDIVAEPLPVEPELYPVTTAMHHYAKGIAYASLKQIAEAEEERTRFHEAVQRLPAGRRLLSNDAQDVLGVAEEMLDGELEYHKGNIEEAFAHLRESVRRDDNLSYTEPWAWMHPPRHALAALLAEQDRYEEAEAVYRDDLGLSGRIQRCTQHPDNVWSLHGLAECLERRGETTELPIIRRKLAAALAKADVPITSSCLCRLSTRPQQSCCPE
jgi:tetratricopeptide (TPR) repeat protein